MLLRRASHRGREDATERIEDALRSLNHPAVDNDTVAVSSPRPRSGRGKVVQAFSQGSNETRPVFWRRHWWRTVWTAKMQHDRRPGCAHVRLASLHQLRGRSDGVGPAVAVFLHPADSERTLAAGARLRAVADADASTGPELARRDLEIRGAGALLGTKQSGRASRAVGDEMYASLLVAELGRLRALDVKKSSGRRNHLYQGGCRSMKLSRLHVKQQRPLRRRMCQAGHRQRRRGRGQTWQIELSNCIAQTGHCGYSVRNKRTERPDDAPRPPQRPGTRPQDPEVTVKCRSRASRLGSTSSRDGWAVGAISREAGRLFTGGCFTRSFLDRQTRSRPAQARRS